MSYYQTGCCGLGALGGIDFSATSVWSDWLKGAKGDNAAGLRAANAIRAALGQLAFGSGISLNQSWGTAEDKSGYTSFAQKYGIAAPTGLPIWWPSQVGLIKLEELVKAGGTPGGGTQVVTHVVNGQIVPGPAPGGGGGTAVAKAGMSPLAIGAIVAVGVVVVGLAVMAKKKKPAGTTYSSTYSTAA